jgi:iron(III) transport system substrate-binding protein
LAVVAAGLALTGCGGGGDDTNGKSLEDVLEQVAGLSGQNRTTKLAALAKGEGARLSFYTTSSIELATELTDAFEDAYDLDVSLLKSSTVVERLAEEREAGFHGADVVESNAVDLNNLSDLDALSQYRSPSAADLVPGSVHEFWAADKLDTLVVAWNTDNVAAGEQPTSYEDLAHPRWKGKLALYIDDSEWYKTLRDYWVDEGKTTAEADRLLESIARNGVFVESRSLIREHLAAGEFDVATSIQRHNLQDMIDDGAPVAYQPAIEPAITRPDGVAIVERPPHPATALLFVDWVLSDGQNIISDFGADAAREDLVVEPAVDRVPVDVEDFLTGQDHWQDRYERLVRLGEKAAPG